MTNNEAGNQEIRLLHCEARNLAQQLKGTKRPLTFQEKIGLISGLEVLGNLTTP